MSGATLYANNDFIPADQARQQDSASCHQQIKIEQTRGFFRWNELIRSTLIRWSNHPEVLDNEDRIAPSSDILQFAIHLAGRFRDSGAETPVRIVTNGEGGVVFEFENELGGTQASNSR